MNAKIEKIKNMFFTKEFLLFVFVGCINTVNGIIFPWIFSHFLDENIAFTLSYVPSLSISYVLNSFITFKEKKLSFSKYIKFVISYMPNFLIQNICYVLVYNILGLPNIFAIIMASAIGVPLTFIIMKLYAFKKGGKVSKNSNT